MVKTNRVEYGDARSRAGSVASQCRVRCPQRTSSASAGDGGRYTAPYRSGFTLVELLAVVGIMAIILVIALPSFDAFKLRSSSSAIPTLMSTLRLARQYAITHRQDVFVVFPDGREAYSPPGDVTKAYTAYAVIASNRATDRYEYITEWKTLPKGVFFVSSVGSSTDTVFRSYGTAANRFTHFPFPNDNASDRSLCTIKFRPNGKAYVVTSASRDRWTSFGYTRIPMTAGYMDLNTNSGTITSTMVLSETNVITIANMSGQIFTTNAP